MIDALRPYRDKRPLVVYDANGVGAYFASPLKESGFRCVGHKASRSPREPERFRLSRDEIHWRFRDRLKAGEVCGLTDPRTIAQLSAIRYSTDPHGRICIESKSEMRKRGVKSPDRAESVLYAFSDHIRAFDIMKSIRLL